MNPVPVDYVRFLAEIKDRIRTAQLRAAVSLNREMLRLYWEIGRSIVERQEREGWGNAVIEKLSSDLRREFPGMRGLSRAGLFHNPLEVGDRDYFVDLLFYHLKLRSLIAFDLKMGEFEPADAGQMNFYLIRRNP